MVCIPVRNPILLTLGLLCLVAAAVLGGLLVHDGEVGTDERVLDEVAVGDGVRVKGTAAPAAPPRLPDLLDHTYTLVADGLTARVLLTSDGPLPGGEAVYEGEVLHSVPDPQDPDGTLVVLVVHGVDTPLVFG